MLELKFLQGRPRRRGSQVLPGGVRAGQRPLRRRPHPPRRPRPRARRPRQVEGRHVRGVARRELPEVTKSCPECDQVLLTAELAFSCAKNAL